MKVFELVAAAIAAEGCRTVFGVVGDGNLSIWGAIGRDGKVPLYSAWHEGAAVAMADAYARSCGQTGIATVTCGPGLTHAATSLITAVRHGSPLVLVIGDLPAGDIAGNQQLDQRGFAEACGARFQNVPVPERAADAIRNAFREARAFSCPVVLNLPMDIQEAEVVGSVAYHPVGEAPAFDTPHPDPSGVDAVIDLITAAQRPVIIAGRGAMAARTRATMVELADRIGAALGTSLHAKGCFSGHPRDIGVVGGIARGSTRRLLSEADLVIALGTTLGHYTTDQGRQLPLAKIVRVDVKPAGRESGPHSALYLQADAGVAARAVLGALDRRAIRKTGFGKIRADSRFTPTPWPDWSVHADGMEPRRVMQQVSSVLPEQAQVACGIGHFWSFPIMHLDMPPGGSFHSTHAFGAIGLALPMGIGLAAAAPDRPVLVIEGDGSLMQALPELESVARQGVSLVLLIMNDAGYGAEAHKMSAKGFDGGMARWNSPDFAALSGLLGGKGVLVEREADVAPAVEAAFRESGLQVIDARISPSVVSDLYQKTLLGIDIE